MNKSLLREELRGLLRKMSPADRLRLSRAACELLVRQPVWQKARSILFYSPLPDELNVSPLFAKAISQGKTIALPRFIEASNSYEAFQIQDTARDCAPGKYGILEPSDGCSKFSLKRLDLILVPGLGFDVTGLRLGRGKGYYDRLLFVTAGIKCGVAFDEQMVPQIPVEPHDVPLNCILTPSRWLDISC